MTLPETRLEARQSGSRYYSTGKACKHGHYAKRKTCDGVCYECACIRAKAYFYESKLLGKIDWSKRNPEKRAEINRRNRKKKPETRYALNAIRRSRKIQACPKWVTKEDHERIKETYKKAISLSKTTGIKFEVDHIIPLQGEIVCGLHVPWNLQVIPKSENIKKSNKLVD
jgi:hypothetical protein